MNNPDETPRGEEPSAMKPTEGGYGFDRRAVKMEKSQALGLPFDVLSYFHYDGGRLMPGPVPLGTGRSPRVRWNPPRIFHRELRFLHCGGIHDGETQSRWR